MLVDRARTRAMNDFKFDARFAAIRDTMKKLHDAPSTYGKPEDLATLEAFGSEIVPTTLFILKYNSQADSAGLYLQYAKWKAAEALNPLLATAYAKDQFAPLAAIRLDAKRAYPQINYLFGQKDNQASAIALAQLGEKRAVTVVIGFIDNDTLPWADEVSVALMVATGQQRRNRGPWLEWWAATG